MTKDTVDPAALDGPVGADGADGGDGEHHDEVGQRELAQRHQQPCVADQVTWHKPKFTNLGPTGTMVF